MIYKKFIILFIIILLITNLMTCDNYFSPREYNDVEDYLKVWELSERIVQYEGHENEPLSTFPSDISNLDVIDFYCYYYLLIVGQPDFQIHLAVKYNDEEYEKEISRLKNIKAEKNIRYDEENLSAPAYVAVWDYAWSYEYAICHEETNSIDYVFIQYARSYDEKIDRSLLPKDFVGLDVQEEEGSVNWIGVDSFTIYK